MKKFSVFGCLMVLSLFVENTRGDVRYTVTDLGSYAGGFPTALSINDSGQVVGESGNLHAFVYCNETMNDINTSISSALGSTISKGYGINDSGQVVGNAYNPVSNISQAFLYYNGVTTSLGLGSAIAINSSGQVVGRNGAGLPCIFNSDATINNVGFGYAVGINDSGQVVGYSRIEGYQAFLYDNGTTTNLGTLPGYRLSYAYGINASGQVVGWAQNPNLNGGPNADAAFLYSEGTMTALGSLPGFSHNYAFGINDKGQVVGGAYNLTGSLGNHAFLCEDGIMKDINNMIDVGLGCTINEAYAINNSGWIVGAGTNRAGQTEAFLLIPVPEPSTFVLFGMGVFGLLSWVWQSSRRKQ